MQRSRQSILPVVALALAFAAGTVAAAIPASPFQGRVRDIDFSSLRTHIIMSGTAAADELVGTVTDDRLQAVLEAAFISGRTAQVVHKNGVISSVTLVGEPTLCSAKGCVDPEVHARAVRSDDLGPLGTGHDDEPPRGRHPPHGDQRPFGRLGARGERERPHHAREGQQALTLMPRCGRCGKRRRARAALALHAIPR